MDHLARTIALLRQRADLQQQELDLLLTNFRASKQDWQPWPDKWSINEQLTHLTRYARHFQKRVQLLLQGQTKLERYVEQEDTSWHSAKKRPPAVVFSEYLRERGNTLGGLRQPDAVDWSCSGSHPVLGTLTLSDWFIFFLQHEGHHIYSLFEMTKIKATYGQ